jgi:hypothetical protein
MMRLSEWRATAPARDAASAKVAGVIDPVLLALGAGNDPHCWIAWGEEPANRFTVLVPTDPGLIVCFVRVNVPGEGARATTKLVRWSKVSIGELAVETQAGHRMLSFQLESQVLRGVDAEADLAAAFAIRVIAAIDGRPLPSDASPSGGKTAPAATTMRTAARPGKASPAKAPPSGPKAAVRARLGSGARPASGAAASGAAASGVAVRRSGASPNADR